MFDSKDNDVQYYKVLVFLKNLNYEIIKIVQKIQ